MGVSLIRAGTGTHGRNHRTDALTTVSTYFVPFMMGTEDAEGNVNYEDLSSMTHV